MRSISRAIVVGALALPLAFAGAGLASAGGKGGDDHCVYYSCNTWWQNSTTVNDQDSIINAGIIG